MTAHLPAHLMMIGNNLQIYAQLQSRYVLVKRELYSQKIVE